MTNPTKGLCEYSRIQYQSCVQLFSSWTEAHSGLKTSAKAYCFAKFNNHSKFSLHTSAVSTLNFTMRNFICLNNPFFPVLTKIPKHSSFRHNWAHSYEIIFFSLTDCKTIHCRSGKYICLASVQTLTVLCKYSKRLVYPGIILQKNRTGETLWNSNFTHLRKKVVQFPVNPMAAVHFQVRSK